MINFKWRRLVFSSLIPMMLSSCLNTGQKGSVTTTAQNPAVLQSVALPVFTHELRNATVDGSGSSLRLSLSANTSVSGYRALTSFCSITLSNQKCFCDLVWSETNNRVSPPVTVERRKQLAVTEVQNGLVRCAMDSGFYAEIPVSARVTMGIVPDTTNRTGLFTRNVVFTKGSSTSGTGDFFDSTLTPFRNIHRYVCYSKRSIIQEITNARVDVTETVNDQSVTRSVVLASRFCAGGSSTGGVSCPQLVSGYSAQSYYRNLYLTSDRLGLINDSNGLYDCPAVKEGIRAADDQKFWPLDAQFSLATQQSNEWSVGVRAPSVLAKNNDPDSQPTQCVNENTNLRMNEKGIATRCLGYAKTPKSDGTCGTVTDSQGRVRPLVRLRRYRVVLPPRFTPTGGLDTNFPAEGDEVYVPDRVVMNGQGQIAATIYGPKPCHYAWYDHNAVTRERTTAPDDRFRNTGRGIPQYRSTHDYSARKIVGADLKKFPVNPDGLLLPNFDFFSTQPNDRPNSCSAALPIVDRLGGVPSTLSVSTWDRSRFTGSSDFDEVHVRPLEAWSPHYVEDTTFQGCVPIAEPFTEPPLYLARAGSDQVYSWCSKAYPTQNPYWYTVNSAKRWTPSSNSVRDALVNYPSGALVSNFTSSPTTGVFSAQNGGARKTTVCGDTAPLVGLNSSDCSSYLAEGSRSNAWDRTIKFDPYKDFRTPPLQAKDEDILAVLQADRTTSKRAYTCTYSYHPDAARIGKSGPSSGCCGPAIGMTTSLSAGTGGHLEPQGTTGDIRFCGTPVE